MQAKPAYSPSFGNRGGFHKLHPEVPEHYRAWCAMHRALFVLSRLPRNP